MKILGVTAGAHSCGCALIDLSKALDECIVLEEERLCRVKPYVDYENDFERFPNESIKCLINRHGVDLNEIDIFTSFLPFDYIENMFRMMNFDGFLLSKEKFVHIDHHDSHSNLSYYLSGFHGDVLIFCADASGSNGFSSKSYWGRNGYMTCIDAITTQRRSLGHYYACLTELLGFKRLKDEGKVVGLSGHGQFWEGLYLGWKDVINVQGTQLNEDIHEIESGGIYLDMHKKLYEHIGSKNYRQKYGLQDMAYTGQLILEETVCELITNIRNKHLPHVKKLALSGGIFANVKLNKKINELDWVDEIFVLPPMGDEGLAFGCAMAVTKKIRPELMPFRFSDMSLGNEYTSSEIHNAGIGFIYNEFSNEAVAQLLKEKKIIGIFNGRSEHGARALGNRSIICEATHQETYDILNKKLERNDFMPFAPAVLNSHADKYFDIPKSRYTTKFMTLLVDTKEEFRDSIPTVVHPIDKTARIQLVDSGFLHGILDRYCDMTGNGLVVNTSFNVHNEPIVETPENAFAHLKSGIIDALATSCGIFTMKEADS
jgi:carbamoyltransferase